VILDDNPTHVVFLRDTAMLVVEPETKATFVESDALWCIDHEAPSLVAQDTPYIVPIVDAALAGVLSGESAPSVYAERADFVGDTLVYRGFAAPSSVDADPVWRIQRIEIFPDTSTVVLWAGGVSSFIHRWTDRLSLEYS
jgi:hypothetical protein